VRLNSRAALRDRRVLWEKKLGPYEILAPIGAGGIQF